MEQIVLTLGAEIGIDLRALGAELLHQRAQRRSADTPADDRCPAAAAVDGEALAQRSQQLQCVAAAQVRQQLRSPSHHLVQEGQCPRLHIDMVDADGPHKERVLLPPALQHVELARRAGGRHLGSQDRQCHHAGNDNVLGTDGYSVVHGVLLAEAVQAG